MSRRQLLEKRTQGVRIPTAAARRCCDVTTHQRGDLGPGTPYQHAAQCAARVIPRRVGGLRRPGRSGCAGHPRSAPTPPHGAGLSLSKISSALKSAGRQRNIDTRARGIQAALRTEQQAGVTGFHLFSSELSSEISFLANGDHNAVEQRAHNHRAQRVVSNWRDARIG
jgi:hypothetical protein